MLASAPETLQRHQVLAQNLPEFEHWWEREPLLPQCVLTMLEMLPECFDDFLGQHLS